MQETQDRFEAFAERLSEQVTRELPKDIPEGDMIVKVGGDNHGNITFGNHIVIHAPSVEDGPRPLSDEQLRTTELKAYQDKWNASKRLWLNMPVAAILAVIGLALAGVISGWFFQIATLQLQLFVGVAIGVLIPCCAWLGRIQQLEKPLIAQSEETIKQVQYERHLRRHT